jgi:hypothetical protein
VTGAAGRGRGRAGGELVLGLLAREAAGWRWLCPSVKTAMAGDVHVRGKGQGRGEREGWGERRGEWRS